MTLVRDGWIDGRGYAVIRDADTGRPEKYLCLECEGELEPDPDAFAAHNCQNYRTGPDMAGVDATPEAAELADEHGVSLDEITGTGQEGRILKSDVEEYIDA